MSVLEQLASTLGTNSEVPNQLLAQKIVAQHDADAVQELISHLKNKNKNVQHDCIKVLYEIGHLKTSLISNYIEDFKQLLQSKNNRLQWGAMTALKTIASVKPKEVYLLLPLLAEIAAKGSIISKDNYISILVQLCAHEPYKDAALTMLHEQFITCPSNQLPMYAENALAVIDVAHKALFIKTLTSRLGDFDKVSKKMRVEKVIKKLAKI